jgi:hypothetical protein
VALAAHASTEAQGATCDEGTAVPPFLGVETVPPNLMLMIDNSGSMYDLNYVENIGYCFDDSYNNSTTYAGYFMTIREIIDNSEVWYTYSAGDMEYVRTTEADKDIDCNAAAGNKYRATDPTGNEFLCASIDETDPDRSKHVPTYFAATGKFLNWIATSKMDVQKQVLTGGKWANHSINGTPQLVPESRGCLGRRLIKEVSVNGGAAKLSFAIRNDDNDIDNDGSYNNTVIDFHAPTTGGFDNTSCQEVLAALQSPTGVGGMTTPLKDCLGGFEEKKTPEGDQISSFNLSMQDCWYMAKFGEAAWRGVFNSAAIRQQCDTLYEGNGFYAGRDPWELPEDVTALVCRGHYNDTIKYNFVGRCYVPAGHPPVALPYTEDQDEQEFQIAGIAEESGSVSGAGILPDWSQAETGYSETPEATATGSFMGLVAEQPARAGGIENGEPRAAIPPAELKKERSSLAEAVREFMRSGGRNEQARQKVLRAFYELFVAEANAAGGVVEETQADCTGSWTNTSGASGGTATYSYVAGDTCTFPAAGSIFTHGLYEVSVISPCEGAGGLRDIAAAFTVTHAGGTTNFVLDQKNNCDVWVKIPGPEENGTFEFLQDSPGSVVVTSNAGKKTYADAVNYAIYKEILPPPPPPSAGYHPYVLQIRPLTVSPTDETMVSFEVTFSEAVMNFNDAADLVITEAGVPAGTLSHTGVTITDIGPVGDQNRIYQVDITGITGAGDISLAVKSWVRDWSENSAAGTYNEQENFIITGPYPDNIRFGKYIVEIGPTASEAVETNLSVGFSTLAQNRGTFIDYPADITCCSGDPTTDYCCNPADYPFMFLCFPTNSPIISLLQAGATMAFGGIG